jgi:stage II sporulation protein D
VKRVLAFLILCACLTPRPPAGGEPQEAPATAPVGPAPRSAPVVAPGDLPPPLPEPIVEEPVQPPPTADLDDPLEFLWSHRLDFAAGGAPLVTIRLMEGKQEIAFRTRGPARLLPRGGAPVAVDPGTVLRAHARDPHSALLAHYPLLSQVEFSDREGLEAARRTWEKRGIRVRARVIGAVYGIAGRVIDNRRHLLLADGDGSEAWERAFLDETSRRHGQRPVTFSETLRRPTGGVEILDRAGRVVASGDALVALEVQGDAGFVVESVEHDVGYAAHGFEDRAYRGRLYLTLDASGRLAAVHAIALEELLRGLVPSEMPASSPLEALKAQAVTARSNVLAQIGTRHLTDPYELCSEVHCQAYRGEAAQVASSDAAVRATAGEALFGKADHRLVDAVYSAMCGGYGEDNEAIWGNLPNPNLRGRPDLPAQDATAWRGGIAGEKRLAEFLATAPAAWCGRASGARKDRYRWERRFTRAEMDALVEPLGVGTVTSLEATSRGVSGRARTLRVSGSQGSTVVHGELRIRRLLRNLPSAMFLVSRNANGWLLRGGGWGHGAGMCQWGAVGRAEAHQTYVEILRAYYSGAEVTRVY